VTKVALVTGGGTGIGAAVTRRLAAGGYAVAVTGRRQGPIEEVARETGGLAVVADTGDAGDAARAVAETVERFGGLDALVCNAGTGGDGSFRSLDPATRDNVLRQPDRRSTSRPSRSAGSRRDGSCVCWGHG
jgi:meso-butanediol dehydrogenase/(S,S)-butanediol dehydrogenase/diacetyl reductase